MAISQQSMDLMIAMENGEATEAVIYRRIAHRVKDENNRAVLQRIADEEAAHALIWQSYTGKEPKVNRTKVFLYTLIAFLFGFTFAVKHMENGEENAQGKYDQLAKEVPEAAQILLDEQRHEEELLGMLDEELLHYVGSMVLGLSDALVELTGTLAGLTFAMQNNRLVALSALITGISATFSMASSEFLSARSSGEGNALKSCLYTGVAYLVTVSLLVLPYLILPADSYWASLILMLVIVVAIIALFNYYIAVAQGLSFRRRFGEMAGISLGVAALSFVVGLLVKQFLGVDI